MSETFLFIRYVLLGEACYPLQSWLMKAYPEERSRGTLTEPQQLFNWHLNRALRVSEGTLAVSEQEERLWAGRGAHHDPGLLHSTQHVRVPRRRL